MIKNVGTLDTAGRVIAGVGLGLAALLGLVSGWVAVSAGGILLATGLTGFCPLYRVCGVSSNRKHTEKESNA